MRIDTEVLMETDPKTEVGGVGAWWEGGRLEGKEEKFDLSLELKLYFSSPLHWPTGLC